MLSSNTCLAIYTMSFLFFARPIVLFHPSKISVLSFNIVQFGM